MTMELEGDLSLERAHTRRWVSIIAVIIPVAAIVLLAAWFIRVYIAPPTVAYSESTDDRGRRPRRPPVVRARADRSAAAADGDGGAGQPAGERTQTAVRAADVCDARGWCRRRSAARPRPTPIRSRTRLAPPPSIMAAEPAAIEPAEPIAGPVPLPRAKPHGRVALLTRCDTAAAAAAGGHRAAAGRHPGGRPPRDPLDPIPSRRRLRSAPAQILPP